jgi:hypothetical protein
MISRGLKIEYNEYYTSLLHLEEDEWTSMINSFFERLKSRPIGKKLYDRLKYHLDTLYTLTISSHNLRERGGGIIFPSSQLYDSRNARLVMPSISYFIDIETINTDYAATLNCSINNQGDLFDPTTLEIINKLSDCTCLKNPWEKKDLYSVEYDVLVKFVPQTYFIIFVHELIHVVRRFEGIPRDDEEESTIYGITGKSLILDGELITENTIRREWGMPPRISHGSKDIFIEDSRKTHENKHLFSKDSFFM